MGRITQVTPAALENDRWSFDLVGLSPVRAARRFCDCLRCAFHCRFRVPFALPAPPGGLEQSANLSSPDRAWRAAMEAWRRCHVRTTNPARRSGRQCNGPVREPLWEGFI